MTINFKKIGALAKVESSAYDDFYFNPAADKVRIAVDDDGKVKVQVANQEYHLSDFTAISVEDAACDDQADFDTKIATVFPNAGGSAQTTSNSDIEITDYTKGLILKTSDGTRARITLIKLGDGTLTSTITAL